MDPDFARQYYESAERDRWWFRGRARIVENLLKGSLDRQVGRVVDLGAGSVSLFTPEVEKVPAQNGVKTQKSSMFYGFLLGPALARKLMGLPSPMAMPSHRLNNVLSRIALASATAASRSGRRIGLSISGLALRS